VGGENFGEGNIFGNGNFGGMSCGEGFFDAGKNSQWEVKILVKETLSAMEISVWDELRRRLF
jgi:hypothetical protein